MFPDVVKIITIEKNTITGREMKQGEMYLRAYWMDRSIIQYGPDGAPLGPEVKLFLPAGSSIRFTDRVQLIKKAGKEVEKPPRKVSRIYNVGDTEPSHIEVHL